MPCVRWKHAVPLASVELSYPDVRDAKVVIILSCGNLPSCHFQVH
jgi:hypothetical protein